MDDPIFNTVNTVGVDENPDLSSSCIKNIIIISLIVWFLWLHTYWSLHSFFVSSSPEKQIQQESERESTPSCICRLSDNMHAFVISHESKGAAVYTNPLAGKVYQNKLRCGTVWIVWVTCLCSDSCRSFCANNDYISISIPENKRQWESESSQGYSPLSPPHKSQGECPVSNLT